MNKELDGLLKKIERQFWLNIIFYSLVFLAIILLLILELTG